VTVFGPQSKARGCRYAAKRHRVGIARDDLQSGSGDTLQAAKTSGRRGPGLGSCRFVKVGLVGLHQGETTTCRAGLGEEQRDGALPLAFAQPAAREPSSNVAKLSRDCDPDKRNKPSGEEECLLDNCP